ncbi:MAG: four helix bundle protein [Candidatus Moranbacteria bacterium]|nr:four helix bundle protein [Candidatus Moranbacteria bacterium]
MKNNERKLVKNFYDLEIWKEANKLSVEVYTLTKAFPESEKFGITSQIRRAASSVGANIAEGFGRYHFKDKIKFYYNARGSTCETQNFIFLSQSLGYLEKENARKIFCKYDNLGKRINQFIKSVGNK